MHLFADIIRLTRIQFRPPVARMRNTEKG